MYDINYDVKYMEVYTELSEKNEYAESDLLAVIHEAYQYDIQRVFGLKDTEDLKSGFHIEIMMKMMENRQFKEVYDNFSKTSLYCLSIRNGRDFKFNSIFFINFDVFWVFHLCVVEYLKTNTISAENIAALDACLPRREDNAGMTTKTLSKIDE